MAVVVGEAVGQEVFLEFLQEEAVEAVAGVGVDTPVELRVELDDVAAVVVVEVAVDLGPGLQLLYLTLDVPHPYLLLRPLRKRLEQCHETVDLAQANQRYL